MAWRKATVNEFLIPREERYKANDHAIAGMPRIEKIDFSGNIVISKKPSKTDMIVIHPGDFVISGINVAKGAMAVYQGGEPIAATIHYSSYTVNKAIIELEYLKRFLKSSVFTQLLNEQVSGGIKTEIKPKHLLPLVIGLPTLPEQKAILERFYNTEDEYGQLVSEIKTQKCLLAKYRQAVLQEAIEGKLTADWREENPCIESAKELLNRIAEEKDELIKQKNLRKSERLAEISENELPFNIPDTWEWCRLLELIYEKPRNGYSAKPVSYPTDTVTLKLGATTTGVFIESETKYINESIPKGSHLWLEPGDILIQRSNSLDYVGVSAIFPGCSHPVIYPDLMMKLQACNGCNVNYLHIFLSSPFCRDYFRKNAKGAQKSMPKINQGTVCNACVALPPLAEQEEIVRRVEAKFALCNTLESEIQQSERQAQTLSTAILHEFLDHAENAK